MVINPLQSGYSRHGQSSCLHQIQALRHHRCVLDIRNFELRVESSLRIGKVDCIYPVANPESPHACAFRHHDACTIGARNQRKLGTSVWPPGTVPHRRVPHPNSGGMQGDQQVLRSRRRNWQRVQLENRWRSEAVESRHLHGSRDGHCLAIFLFRSRHIRSCSSMQRKTWFVRTQVSKGDAPQIGCVAARLCRLVTQHWRHNSPRE